MRDVDSPSPESSSWTSPIKMGAQLSVGDLFRNSPAKLLEHLEKNLVEILAVHPELKSENLDPLPLFPATVSLKDLNDFYGLLECEIFSNYLNLFLNLPLFSRRMTYQNKLKQFSLDPPLKRRKFRVDHGMVTGWVLVCRLPYFLKSHLYLEYRFCFELLNDLCFDGKSLHLFHELKTAIGINRFRIFLSSRDMANLMSFWMDSEKFNLLNDDKSRKEAFNAIEILYLKPGSRFQLPEELRKNIMQKIEKEPISAIMEVMVHGVPLVERIKKKEVDKIRNFEVVGFLLTTAQHEVMTFLRNYWIPRYFIRNGLPYTDSINTNATTIKSHLVWGEQHKVSPSEPIRLTGFKGQAPNDFKSLGEHLHTRLPEESANFSKNSIWNLDLSSKIHRNTLNKGQMKKMSKFNKEFTLFEQARKRSMAVTRSSQQYLSQLSELRQSIQANKYKTSERTASCSPSPLRFNPGGALLEPLGVDFSRNRIDSQSPNRLSVSPAMRRSRSVVPQSPDVKLPSIEVAESDNRTAVSITTSSAANAGTSVPMSTAVTDAGPVVSMAITAADNSSDEEELPNISPQTQDSSPTNEDNLLVLPKLTKDLSFHRMSTISLTCSVVPEVPSQYEIWDPYLLLERVNPDLLLEEITEEHLNTRKWILGALAANCLAGNPIRDYFSTSFFAYNEDADYLARHTVHSAKISQALNNLDCWERIERIRSTSGTSYAGRRADEITIAGGWSGLDSPPLLPNYHYYLASLSGELLEAHLHPFMETKHIINQYLSSPDELAIDEEVMGVLREMLRGSSVDDSWFALLQEHNLTQLKDYILKYFVWDDQRLLVNCAPAKQTCKHRVLIHSRSSSAIEHAAFGPETEQDLTNQYIFSPRSEQVWLSLFALEVCSYRPAEVYFPPIPTTTKSVGCSCDKDAISSRQFDPVELEKSARPRSVLMTESQATLPKLKDCRMSPKKKKKTRPLLKPSVSPIKKTESRRISTSGSQSSFMTVSESSTVIGSYKKRNKKLYPNSFRQVLAEPQFFGIFMKYLEFNLVDEAEAPLINFWHQVEIMKSYTNPKARKDKAFSVHKKYLYMANNGPKREYLKAHAESCPQLIDIAERKNITPNMMMSAQVYVCKLLEDKWWIQYKAFLEDENSAKLILTSSSDVTNANIDCGKDYRVNIRYLWGIFTFDLINFQRGLQNKTVYNQFKSYLKKTALKLRMSKGRRMKEGGAFTFINGITVFADRLENDLDFFTELSKWISLKCDMSQGKKGKLTKASEALLTSKANAIVACYIRSVVPPRTRVNLIHSIITDIEKRLDDKKFHRGLFYHAVLHMITMLLPFWKKFCFILSAKKSRKDHVNLQTVSGHAISDQSLAELEHKEAYCEEKHLEKLGKLVEEKVQKEDAIKGLGERLLNQDKVLARRDAFVVSAPQENNHITEVLVYQFSLLAGMCRVKHESGVEVPHVCETLVTPWMERIEYLRSPLPRIKSNVPVITLPVGQNNNTPNKKTRTTRAHSKMVRWQQQ